MTDMPFFQEFMVFTNEQIFDLCQIKSISFLCFVLVAYVEKCSFVRGAFQETLSIFSVAPIFFLGSRSNKHKKITTSGSSK